MKNIYLGLLFWIISLVPAAGQEGYSDRAVKFPQYDFRFFPERKGKFEVMLNNVDDPYNYGYDKKQEAQLKEKLKKAISALNDFKTINPPKGVNAKVYALTQVTKPFEGMTPRLSAMLELYFFAIQEGDDGKPYIAGGTSNSVSFFFNNPLRIVGAPVLDQFYCLPSNTGKFLGYDVYYNGKEEVTILTNSKKPLYLPVSNKEYLETMIRETKKRRSDALAEGNKEENKLSPRESFNKEKQERLKVFRKAYAEILKVDKKAAAEYKKTFEETEKELEAELSSNADYSVTGKELTLQGDEYYKNEINSLTEELNSLSAEEKKKQAYYSSSAYEKRFSGLSYGDIQEAAPLVKINPDFFDRALPMSEIQMITVIWQEFKPGKYDGSREGFKLEEWYLNEITSYRNFWQVLISLLAK